MNPSKNFLRATMKFLPKLFGVFRVRREIDWPSVFEKDDINKIYLLFCCPKQLFLFGEKNMKKFFLAALSLAMIFGLLACKNEDKQTSEKAAIKNAETTNEQTSGDKKELYVFAAASLTESLEEIKAAYEKGNPDLEIIYTFDSSGTLKTQIEEGAYADIFISAAQKQMNALDPEKNPEAKDKIIDPESRIDLLENKVCLVVPKGSTKDIKTFEDLNSDRVETLALGNSDVPVGQYSEEILRNLGSWDAIQEKITFGSNVKEVTTWIVEGVVDCGIIYKTDAYSAGLDVVYEEDGSHLDTPVIYPAALLKESENLEEARKLLAYFQGPEAMEIFQSVGFSPAK